MPTHGHSMPMDNPGSGCRYSKGDRGRNSKCADLRSRLATSPQKLNRGEDASRYFKLAVQIKPRICICRLMLSNLQPGQGNNRSPETSGPEMRRHPTFWQPPIRMASQPATNHPDGVSGARTPWSYKSARDIFPGARAPCSRPRRQIPAVSVQKAQMSLARNPEGRRRLCRFGCRIFPARRRLAMSATISRLMRHLLSRSTLILLTSRQMRPWERWLKSAWESIASPTALSYAQKALSLRHRRCIALRHRGRRLRRHGRNTT